MELVSHFPRYRQIFHVFFKYGFGDVLKRMRLQKLLEIAEQNLPGTVDFTKSTPERFRMALDELGPTFVKFGQVLSTRRDLVDESWVLELSKLQDQVSPFPGKQAAAIVERELNRPLSALFKEFDETPLAAASMAQVHKAVLPNGEPVAVKVQRPDISKVIEVDLAILLDAATFLEKHVEPIAALDPVGIIKEFARTIEAEEDFTTEARNTERFARQFGRDSVVCVPRVHRELSTNRVLTMQFIAGRRLDDLEYMKAHKINPVKVSEQLSKFIFQQIFHHGFFHGDPHPGNMAILPNGHPVLYDYGMMGTLNPRFREDIASMVMGLSEHDHRLVCRSIMGMSKQGSVRDVRELEADVEAFSNLYLDRPLKEIKLSYIFNRLLEVLMRHHLRMKPEFYLGVKALSQVESLGALLNPDIEFIELGKPFAIEVLEKKWEFRTMLRNAYTALAGTMEIFRDLPLDAREFYDRIKAGRVSIPIEHRIDSQGFEPLRETLTLVANRLTHAIAMASVLLCSAILVLAGLPPKWNDCSVPGAIGLVVGCYLALRLWLSMGKRGGP